MAGLVLLAVDVSDRRARAALLLAVGGGWKDVLGGRGRDGLLSDSSSSSAAWLKSLW